MTKEKRYRATIKLIEIQRYQLEELADEYQDWIDSLPDNLQDSALAEDIDAMIYDINDQIEALDGVIGAAEDMTFPGSKR